MVVAAPLVVDSGYISSRPAISSTLVLEGDVFKQGEKREFGGGCWVTSGLIGGAGVVASAVGDCNTNWAASFGRPNLTHSAGET